MTIAEVLTMLSIALIVAFVLAIVAFVLAIFVCFSGLPPYVSLPISITISLLAGTVMGRYLECN